MMFTNANFARIDADAVSRLIDNGEWDRALTHAEMLVRSIRGTMTDLGIEPTKFYIHDSTAA
jgi:hypothetical protein